MRVVAEVPEVAAQHVELAHIANPRLPLALAGVEPLLRRVLRDDALDDAARASEALDQHHRILIGDRQYLREQRAYRVVKQGAPGVPEQELEAPRQDLLALERVEDCAAAASRQQGQEKDQLEGGAADGAHSPPDGRRGGRLHLDSPVQEGSHLLEVGADEVAEPAVEGRHVHGHPAQAAHGAIEAHPRWQRLADVRLVDGDPDSQHLLSVEPQRMRREGRVDREGSLHLLGRGVVQRAKQHRHRGRRATRIVTQSVRHQQVDRVPRRGVPDQVVGETDGVLAREELPQDHGEVLQGVGAQPLVLEQGHEPAHEALRREHQLQLGLCAHQAGEELGDGPRVEPVHELLEDSLVPARLQGRGRRLRTSPKEHRGGAREVAGEDRVDLARWSGIQEGPELLEDLLVVRIRPDLEELVDAAGDELHRHEGVGEAERARGVIRRLPGDELHELQHGVGPAEPGDELALPRLELLDDVLLVQECLDAAVGGLQQDVQRARPGEVAVAKHLPEGPAVHSGHGECGPHGAAPCCHGAAAAGHHWPRVTPSPEGGHPKN
mmetsp:Transcript_70212/g.205877  ORF Transcript_70212/g.205877 Transcript_70212/m.205877 type:complete len:551 (-) Transcript_70212:19-1671(-)